MEYEVFRGLKKPLLLFGLKDRYIYQALGLGGGGAVLAIVLSSFIGLIGLFLGLLIAGIGIALIYRVQERQGLYKKTRNEKTLYVFSSKMRLPSEAICNHLKT